MRRLVGLVFVWLVACGDDSAPVTVPPPPTPTPTYELHEWGLLAYHVAAEHETILAAASPLVERPPGYIAPSWGGGGGGVGYKPVIYVHLGPDTDHVDLELAVHAPGGGRFVETFPLAQSEGETIRWHQLQAVRSPAEGCGARYPHTPDGRPVDCWSSDSYCEAENGASYEATDGACLRFWTIDIHAPRYDYLLYRVAMGRTALPVSVARADDGTLTMTSSASAPASLEVFRITRSLDDATFTAAVFQAPAAGQSTPVPTSDAAQTTGVLDRILAGVTDAGLTVPERDAFAHAWHDAIVPQPDEGTTRSRFAYPGRDQLAPVARPPTDALYYWLPIDAANAALPIDATPAPSALHRALLVRIALSDDDPDLAEVATYGLVLDEHHVRATGVNAHAATNAMLQQSDLVRTCAALSHIAHTTTVRFHVAVTSAGTPTVDHVTVDPGDATLARCITDTIGTWHFPDADAAGGAIDATMTLTPPPRD